MKKDIEYEIDIVETRLLELKNLAIDGLSLNELEEKTQLEDRLNGLKEKLVNYFALEKIRTKKGLTRPQLSELSKIHIQTIKALEMGYNDPKNAKLSTLVALAKVLKCRVRDFYPNEKHI